MPDKIKVNEADLGLIENNLIDYLKSDPRFENYNFKAGALPVFIRVAKFVVRNLAFQLNKTVEEIFLDTATLEPAIMSLIQNFNFIPEMRRPAKRYLKINYDMTGYTPQLNSQFKMFFNSFKYTTDFQGIPTLRDKWQQQHYTDMDVNDFLYQNMFYCQLEKNIGDPDLLETVIPVYQAQWTAIEEVVDILDFNQKIELVDGDGNYYLDKVVKDSIRVFVRENADSQWYEYFNVKEGNFDEELRTYNMTYNVENGLGIQFDIDHLSRSILDGEVVRVFFAITEGDEINDSQGTNVFDHEDFFDFQILEVETDGSENVIAEWLSSGGASTMIPADMASEERFVAELIDGDGVLALFDNGVEKQSLDSIKISAPLFRSTQGRAVTESDYNVLLKNKFSEYKEIRAWGGQREFYDVEELLNASIAVYPDPVQAFKNVLMNLYKEGNLSIESPTYTDIEDGKFRRDLGFVYYTFFDEGFNFAHDSENVEEIVKYLDGDKILTIYFRHFSPIFNLLRPRIKVTLNPSFASEFSYLETKKYIRDWVNNNMSQRRIDLQDLNSYLLALDSVGSVDYIRFTSMAKYLHKATPEENVVRIFNRFDGEQVMSLKHWSGDELVEIATLWTISGNNELWLTIGGADSLVGTVNKEVGFMKFSSASLNAFAGESLYIDGIETTGLKVNSLRECFVGIERISDIEIIAE